MGWWFTRLSHLPTDARLLPSSPPRGRPGARLKVAPLYRFRPRSPTGVGLFFVAFVMVADSPLLLIPESRTSSGAAPERLGNGILRARFNATKDTALEQAMDKGESWARKVASGDSGVKLDDIPKLIAVLGLKLVSRERICITPEEKRRYDALEVIAAQALNPAPKLSFEDPE